MSTDKPTTVPPDFTEQGRQLVDKEKTMIKCRLCGKGPTEVKAVLHRVNEKGVEGIWECRPICGAEMDDGDAISAAIEGVFDSKPFGYEARKLVEQCVTDASRVPCDCEDLWCIHWKDEVSKRIASALAEAATQGQSVGIERAAVEACTVCQDSTYWKPATKVSDGFWLHEHKTHGYTTRCGAPHIRALSPDPSYLNRVRNEAATVIVNSLACDVLEVCRIRGWSLHWTHRGAYLHLESSELIEAVRGKHGDPLKEAGDVLLVLMSITENQGIPFDAVLEQAKQTANELKSKPRYAGEEYDDGNR